MAKIAWIGLGVMGAPMAGHLATAGHGLAVFNRDPAKAVAWVAARGTGRAAKTPADAAKDADFVFSCVGNDADVRAVATGADGAFHGMKAGAVFIDHTTTSAELARELHEKARDKDLGFIDAPVSGGQSGAENGSLTVMCGGGADVFARVQPIVARYARAVSLIGPPGAGQLTKMVNQICIAGLIQSLAEGVHFAQRAGLDLEKVMETISKGAAQSWQMENRWRSMSEGRFDFGFAVDWMRKDLGFCLEESRRNHAVLPVAALVDRFYADVQAMGGGRWDTSSLIARLGPPAPKAETR